MGWASCPPPPQRGGNAGAPGKKYRHERKLRGDPASEAGAEAGRSAQTVLAEAKTLSGQADTLQQVVSTFLSGIRAG